MDPRTERVSGLARDPARPTGPAGTTHGALLRATHPVAAAAEWPAPAARNVRSCASASPSLSPRSIAITGILADLCASVERLGAELCAIGSWGPVGGSGRVWFDA